MKIDDEEFHLTIKNNLRKIVDVRNVFKNLSPYEKQILEYHKVQAEKRKLRQEAQLNEPISRYHSLAEFTVNPASTSGNANQPKKKALKRPNEPVRVFKKPKTNENAPNPKESTQSVLKMKSVNFDEKNIYYSDTRKNPLNNRPKMESQENTFRTIPIHEIRKEFTEVQKKHEPILANVYGNVVKTPKTDQDRLKSRSREKNVYTRDPLLTPTKYVSHRQTTEYFSKNVSPIKHGYYSNYTHHHPFMYDKRNPNVFLNENAIKEDIYGLKQNKENHLNKHKTVNDTNVYNFQRNSHYTNNNYSQHQQQQIHYQQHSYFQGKPRDLNAKYNFYSPPPFMVPFMTLFKSAKQFRY